MEHDLARELDEYVAYLDGVIHAVEVNVVAIVDTWDGSDVRSLVRLVDEAINDAERKLVRSARTAALESVMAEALVTSLTRSGSAAAPEQVVAKLLLLSERVGELLSRSRRRNGPATD
jgi:hypothetical protein